MKKKIVIAALLVGGFTANQLSAQKYLGLSNSNYSGVYGSQYNPAKLADNKVKFALNLASVNALVNNNLYEFKRKDVFDNFSNFNLNTLAREARANDAAVAKIGVMGEILGPSFQFTTSDRLGFSAGTRMRAFAQANDINTNFLRVVSSSNPTITQFTDNTKFGFNTNALTDIGVGAAYALVDNDAVRFSLGLKAKLYRGIGYGQLESNRINVTGVATNNGVTTAMVNDIDWNLYTNYKTDQNITSSFKNIGNALTALFGGGSDLNTGTAFGGDIGAELTFKGNSTERPYSIKLGASLNDLGTSVKYRGINHYHVTKGTNTAPINLANLDPSDVSATVNYLRTRGFNVTETQVDREVALPMNLNVSADYAISNKFFVAANALVNLAKTTEANSYYYNYVNLAPRFESKWFDVSVPLSYNLMSKDFKPGLAFRLGPLSVGSDDLKILFTDAKGANVYAGLGFVLAKPTDKDGDGVLDNKDACKDVAGPAENNGCPWPDTDGDGVLDKDDACPQEAGVAALNGCPDGDGDGVADKDDKCPTEAGAADNNGCPWPDTDGDGVADREDDCPKVPGEKELKGCPKVVSVEEISMKATGALSGIIFDFGKSTISSASNPKLDQAAEIIKSANGGNFLVTGHTDKRGSDALNLKISRERAASVVRALEARGVNPNQLKSTGVGERDAQVAETASDEERAKDRKVVVQAIDATAWEALQKSDLSVVKKKPVKRTVRKVAPKKRRK